MSSRAYHYLAAEELLEEAQRYKPDTAIRDSLLQEATLHAILATTDREVAAQAGVIQKVADSRQ